MGRWFTVDTFPIFKLSRQRQRFSAKNGYRSDAKLDDCDREAIRQHSDSVVSGGRLRDNAEGEGRLNVHFNMVGDPVQVMPR